MTYERAPSHFADGLSDDLQAALDDVVERANVCRLITLDDLDHALPARSLGHIEIALILAALADHGLHLIEPDAADQLAQRP